MSDPKAWATASPEGRATAGAVESTVNQRTLVGVTSANVAMLAVDAASCEKTDVANELGAGAGVAATSMLEALSGMVMLT
jgi:hypothetical protein